MSFYDLPKDERTTLVKKINETILAEIKTGKDKNIFCYFADEDTYIRKSAYLSIGRIYQENKDLQRKIKTALERLLKEPDFKIRQTVINAAGEIGKTDFDTVEHFFDKGLLDTHHSVRNAVIGSIKKWERKIPNRFVHQREAVDLSLSNYSASHFSRFVFFC